MLTKDMKEVQWKHSQCPVAPFVTAEQVAVLASDAAVEKAIILGELSSRQVAILFSDPSKYNGARQLRSLGRRIKKCKVEEYARTHYLQKLQRIFSRFPDRTYGKEWQRKDLVKALLAKASDSA
jgi:hypothetical protein